MTRLAVWLRLASAGACALLSLANAPVAHAQFAPGFQYYNQLGLSVVDAQGAFNQGYTGKGVTIGVVDSGINPNHVAFGNALVAAMGWNRSDPSEIYVNNWVATTGTSNFSTFINDLNADGSTVNGHGTFVSSIAAGRMTNVVSANNVMGVAYESKLVLGQYVFNDKDENGVEIPGLNAAQVAQSIDYVSSQPGVRVINNSWGVPASAQTPMLDAMHDYAESGSDIIGALKRAQNRGIVIVFAAGNDKVPWPGTPATLPSIDDDVRRKGGWIVVAATTNRGINPATGQIEMARVNPDLNAPSFYTNFCGAAALYCISAPGGLMEPGAALGDVATGGANAESNTDYKRGDGTSYATPFVAGAVALVAQKYPWMTSKNLGVTILTTGTTAANPSEIWGRGLLDIGRAINGPGIFEEDFEANVTAGYRSTFSNDISGQAGLIKDGAGTLVLAGVNTYLGPTEILGGTLGLAGQGSIARSAWVRNAGTFDLTAANPVVNLANDYTQTSAASLVLGIRPGQAQQLVVGGTATLAGALNVQAAAGSYAPGRFTVLSANTVAGQFDTFATNLGAYTPYKTYQSYGGSNVYLNIVRPYADTVVENGNAVSRGAAQSLYDIAGTPSSINGAMAPVLNAINGMSGPAQSVAIRQTLPVFTGGASQATYNTQRAFQQTVMARIDNIRGMESGDYFATDRSVWMKPFGNITSQSGQGESAGYRATGGGVAVGVDNRLTDAATLGGVFAYSYNAIGGSGDVASNNLGINAFQLGLYGAYALSGDTDLSVQADFGLNQNRETRSIGFMRSAAQANYNSTTSHVGAGIKKVIPASVDLNVIPSVRIDYAAINANAYTESGAGVLNLNVQSQTYQELMLTAGLKGDYQVTDRIKLTANAGGGYNTLNNQNQVVASYAGGGNSFVTQAYTGSPWLYSAGVGVVGFEKEGIELSARYDVQASPTGFLNQMASVRLAMRY